jgi:CubicO group peptidase (beta-lactamase class C family)
MAISTLDDRLPSREPADVGMSAERLAAIDRIVRRGITAGGFPGAAVIVGRDGFSVLRRGFGRLEYASTSRVVSPDESIYDLASLTKVVGTTTAAMILFDEGKLNLDAPVRTYLPEFSGGLKDRVTVRHLLSHQSGLPPGRVLWGKARSAEEARRLVIETPLQSGCPPGKCFDYSDLGADVLGFLIEAVSGQSLDSFLQKRLFEPLQMQNTSFRPPASARANIAPTADVSRRGYPLRGEVHDENAYLLGGVAGHAGLFSTAADLGVFAQMMLNRGELNGKRIVAESTVDIFTTEQGHGRALGWEVGAGIHGAGSFLSNRAYGHTGFTGTSLWIDPERRTFIVLLTNRVFAPRARRPADVISDVRNDIADAVATSVLDETTGVPTISMTGAFRSDTAKRWNAVKKPSGKKAPAAAAKKPVAPPPPTPAKPAGAGQSAPPPR